MGSELLVNCWHSSETEVSWNKNKKYKRLDKKGAGEGRNETVKVSFNISYDSNYTHISLDLKGDFKDTFILFLLALCKHKKKK